MIQLKPAAIAIVYNKESHILLVKRKDVPIWVLPGGGLEAGERAEEAAVREVWEETGLKISIQRQSGEYYPTNRLTSPTSVFIGHTLDNNIRLSEECSEGAFFSLQELPKGLFFLHRDWIKEALTASTLIKKPISQITYWAVLKFALQHPWQLIKYLTTRITKKD